MKGCAGFWVGMSAGLLAGAAMGMMSPYGRDPMKTQVGKSIRKLGIAVDNAVDNIVSDLRRTKGTGRAVPSLLLSVSKNPFRPAEQVFRTL